MIHRVKQIQSQFNSHHHRLYPIISGRVKLLNRRRRRKVAISARIMEETKIFFKNFNTVIGEDTCLPVK
ncbi:hypothetical protein BLA29_006737 [Euroglyphus maynei]|uniref:Uncharacterized protein n=1 Tax=Euroglyphus maynei TaxID=6958 RepID=A0A1Y3ALX9_EURMA|nr:hypothetical protein BLA29_006737 [Euroglyphus maynei]